ncbi:MAG: hypothetical protein LBJ12_01085 [Oscillospiraceae bacterium]|jgi:hypothetical protein|nr:hypothetical protein [Oscillospiraceae bacterium]
MLVLEIKIEIKDELHVGGLAGIREDLAAYCEKFGDIKLVRCEEQVLEQINFFTARHEGRR